MIFLAFSKLSIRAAAQLSVCSVHGAVPDYYIRLLRSDYVPEGIFLWLSSPLVSVLSHLGFYKIAEKMRIESVLVALAFHRIIEVDWSSSGVPYELIVYDFTRSTVYLYPAEILAQVKGHKLMIVP